MLPERFEEMGTLTPERRRRRPPSPKMDTVALLVGARREGAKTPPTAKRERERSSGERGSGEGVGVGRGRAGETPAVSIVSSGRHSHSPAMKGRSHSPTSMSSSFMSGSPIQRMESLSQSSQRAGIPISVPRNLSINHVRNLFEWKSSPPKASRAESYVLNIPDLIWEKGEREGPIHVVSHGSIDSLVHLIWREAEMPFFKIYSDSAD
jgi:hypothetical protein